MRNLPEMDQVSFHCLDERSSVHAVEHREIGVQHDLVTADHDNCPRAAERFQIAVEQCIEAIAEAPERYPKSSPACDGGSSGNDFRTPSCIVS